MMSTWHLKVNLVRIVVTKYQNNIFLWMLRMLLDNLSMPSPVTAEHLSVTT